jgi:hypothetical protein
VFGRLLAFHTNIKLGWERMAVANTLAYNDEATITAVKTLMAQTNVKNFLRLYLTNFCNKLEYLSLARFSSLVCEEPPSSEAPEMFYTREGTIRSSPIKEPVLPTNIRLGWKSLPVINALAY